MKILFILAAFFCVFLCVAACAQEITPQIEVKADKQVSSVKQRFNIGAGYWHTKAFMNWYIYADKAYYLLINDYIIPIANKGDKFSELNYDTDSGLFIVNAEAWIYWRLYVDGFVGWGKIEDNDQRKDLDWWPQYSPDLMAFSISDAEGDVTTWNVNGYFRLLEQPEDKGYLDFALGYAYYQDDIEHITNGIQTLAYYQQINEPLTGQDGADKFTYGGIRLGARCRIPLHDRVAVKGSVGIMPWLNLDHDAFWSLRADHGPPPGRKMVTKNGDATGFDCNIGIEFKFTKNLFIEAGYRYLRFDSEVCDQTYTYLSGPVFEFKDSLEAESGRGGFYAMGRVKL